MTSYFVIHGQSVKILFLVYKPFLSLVPRYLCKLIMCQIPDCPLCSLYRNDLLVPWSRMSTSQQCAFVSAGPLLWNHLPALIRAQILSVSSSCTLCLLRSFFPGSYHGDVGVCTVPCNRRVAGSNLPQATA